MMACLDLSKMQHPGEKTSDWDLALMVALALMAGGQQNQPVVHENQPYQAWLTSLPLAAHGFSSRR